MKPVDMFKRMQRLQRGSGLVPDLNLLGIPDAEKNLMLEYGVLPREKRKISPAEAAGLYDPGEGAPVDPEEQERERDALVQANEDDAWEKTLQRRRETVYGTMGIEVNGEEIEIPVWDEDMTPEQAEDAARDRLELDLDPFASDMELDAAIEANGARLDAERNAQQLTPELYSKTYAEGEEDVEAELARGRPRRPLTKKELENEDSLMRDIIRSIPWFGREGPQFNPKSVPVIQWEGESLRHYEPDLGAEDERLIAKEGNANIEPLKLAGGSSGLPGGFTSFWPGGGRWEGPNRVAAGSNILGGHPWQYYDINNPDAPWIGLEGPRGSLGEWRKIPGESRMGRVIDVKQKGYSGYGILKKGQYDRRGNWIPGSGGSGGSGTIPGGPFEGWTPQAMEQWHSGTPPSGMNYPEFTGNTAGPGGQQLAYETTSYNIPGYGWVPRATLNNAQASNNLWDYLNPWGGTSKGGANTGDPTQRGIGMAVGTASNFIIPGLGFVTGPIARWITSKFQGQNPTPKQVQQAVQQAQAQGKLPPMPKGSVPLPTQPGQGGSGNFSPSYLRSIGYTPGQGTGSLWPGGGDVGGGSIGGGGSFYGGNLAPHWGSTAIGFGGSYGGGSNAGDTSRFMSGAGYNRPYSAEQWANLRGSKKYAAPTLSTAEGGITPQMGYEQYLQMFHPIGSVGSSTGPGGAAYSGGGPQGIGGGKTSFKPNLNQKVFAMGTSDVNPGLKLFHTTQLKRKKK